MIECNDTDLARFLLYQSGALSAFKDFDQGDQIEIVSMHYDIFEIVIVVRWGDDERTFKLKAVRQ